MNINLMSVTEFCAEALVVSITIALLVMIWSVAVWSIYGIYSMIKDGIK